MHQFGSHCDVREMEKKNYLHRVSTFLYISLYISLANSLQHNIYPHYIRNRSVAPHGCASSLL